MKTLIQSQLKKLNLRLSRIRPSGYDYRLNAYLDRARPAVPRFLNIGAGDFFHPYWHNLDIPNSFYEKRGQENIHIEYDLASMSSFPVDQETLEIAYMSHVSEHLSDAANHFVYTSIFKALRSGGVFRVTCPDAGLLYTAAMQRDEYIWMHPSPWGTSLGNIEQRFLEYICTELTRDGLGRPAVVIPTGDLAGILRSGLSPALNRLVSLAPNRFVRPEYHVTWFDVEKMCLFLRQAGFRNVTVSKYGQSSDVRLRDTVLFDNTCPYLSLFVEAVK